MKAEPLYRQVKDDILKRMAGGELLPGMRIESEAELVARHAVSRMTVNRALRELTSEGRLYRVQGRGTFVARARARSPLLEIRSIAEEIRERGGRYSAEVHLLQEEKLQPAVAAQMGLPPYTTVFHSVIIHKDSDLPIQLGYRYVNPAIAPDYLSQDFTEQTPSDYLLHLVPVSRVEQTVEALIPESWIRELLQISSGEPCLALHRKTWVEEQVVTLSTFYYPGSRYTLGGRFSPGADGTVTVC